MNMDTGTEIYISPIVIGGIILFVGILVMFFLGGGKSED